MQQKQDMIRLLNADEIECRVATASEKGVSLLLYKDARVDQRILDESFGPFGWKRSHQCIDGKLYCTVEVLNKETGEWIAKQDVGAAGSVAGLADRDKSQASDSFKRACFNWGIGRELYTAPFIFIPAGKAAVIKKDNKYVCNDHFNVTSITYKDKEIASLTIENDKKQTVYELKEKKATKAKDEQEQTEEGKKGILSKTQMVSLQKELNRTGVTVENVQERYDVQNLNDMSGELYNKVMSALKKTKSAVAA